MARAMEGFHSFSQPDGVKMNKPFISLCPEITRAHALLLMDWLEDEGVTRYLSDARDVSRSIGQVVGRVQLPVLTHLFNQGGRFFMACDRHDVPVGFVRLVKDGPDCEMVLAIGDRANWGRRLGASAIREGMKLAFFDMRAQRLIAKVHPDNARSLNAFLRSGFALHSEGPSVTSLAMGADRYLRLLRESPAAGIPSIHVTEIDEARLRELVAFHQDPEIFELEHEIERATVVDPRQVAEDVVTMNSRALLEVDGETVEVALVYPQDADEAAGRHSVCSGLGTAILGYREGDAFRWRIADRTRRIRVRKVLYQPEARGDFHL
ncbi:GNAT family N-acetyltransferase [Paracidovorax avenae]|uniref:bifunctional GNAT family N-acetyltransferase/nucleoside diphosphate kinase regulator n=1 Tax=Paracidovorax avenae TaxID=80867 RepID=UPI000D15D28B|nr:bifunctional GNAT family N-acetyltransferase/nucleoside diphosphate kinase regulator [Paracidovorax avenae]AVS69188.1 GNAT family N-acetyltransferase [Paracidovorax avenae]